MMQQKKRIEVFTTPQQAVRLLLIPVIDEILKTLKCEGIEFYKDYRYSNSYKTFKERVKYTRRVGKQIVIIPVSNAHCDTSILGEEYNYKARCIHELLHWKHSIQFDYESERALAILQADLFDKTAARLGLCIFEREKIQSYLYIDNNLQGAFYKTEKEFVLNQTRFFNWCWTNYVTESNVYNYVNIK